jgi:hypothetical protein
VRYNGVDDVMRLGDVLARSGMFADARQGAQAVTKILAGAEMGFGAIAAMTGIHVINGRVSVGANLMASAVKKSGKYDYRVLEMSEQTCSIEFFQKEAGKWESLGKSAFTAADAKKAGTKNMDKYARNMLFARAMSNGVRWYCPDALGGAPVYTPEEMGADTDEEGNVIQAAAVEVAAVAQEPPRILNKPTATKEQHEKINNLGKSIYGSSWGSASLNLIDLHRTGATRLSEMTEGEAEDLFDHLTNIHNAKQEAVPA